MPPCVIGPINRLEDPSQPGQFGELVQPAGDHRRASTFLLFHDTDRLDILFGEPHGFPTGRVDLVSLSGFANVVFRLDLVPGFSQVRGGYFRNKHLAGRFVMKDNI